MRRRFRWAFNLAAAAVSAVLFVGVCVLWVRGYWVSDSVYWSRWWLEGRTGNESAYWLLPGRGSVGIAHRSRRAVQRPEALADFGSLVDHPEFSWKAQAPPQHPSGLPPDGLSLHRLGFRFVDSPMPAAFVAVGVTGGYRVWVVPAWSLALASLTLPARRLAQLCSRRRATRPGRCPACGYDLTGNVSGVCPECGTAQAPAAPAAGRLTP